MKKTLSLLTYLSFCACAVSFGAVLTEIEGSASADNPTSLDAYNSNTGLTVNAPADAETVFLQGTDAELFFLNVNGDCNYDVSGGLSLLRNTSGVGLTFMGDPTKSSSLTFRDGNYNFGSASQHLNYFTMSISGLSPNDNAVKSIVFDSDTVVKAYTSELRLEGPFKTNYATESFFVKGTMDILKPNSTERGNLSVKNGYGTFPDPSDPSKNVTRGLRTGLIVDGGTLNVADVTVNNYTKLSVRNGGTLDSNGTLSLLGSNSDQSPFLTVEANSTANLNNLLLRPGATSTSKQANVKVDVYGTMNVDGTLSFQSQLEDATEIASSVAVNVKNGGSTNVAVLDFAKYGNISVESGGSMSVTDSATVAGTSTVKNAGTLSVSNLNMSGGTLTLSNGSTTNISGESSITGGTYSVGNANINVTGGNLNYAANNLTLSSMGDDKAFTVKTGANFVSATDFEVKGGTFKLESGSTATVNTFKSTTNKTNIDGTLIVTKSDAANFTALNIAADSTVTFDKNGSFDAVNGSAARIFLYGDLIVNSGEKSIETKQIVFWGTKNYLELNSKNAFVSTNGTDKTDLNVAKGVHFNLKVTATNEFGKFTVQGDQENDSGVVTSETGVYLELDFANPDDYISFVSPDFFEVADIYVTNFADNKIKFHSITNLKDKVIFYDANNGNKVIDVDFVGDSVGGGYWVVASIPEPAEWAAIFGVIALAFAAYRRRK